MDRRPLGFPEVSGMGVLAVVPLGPVGCWMGSLWIGLAPAHPADPDRILTWGIWMPGQYTEPFLTFLGPFLDVSCGVAGWRGVCLWQCLDRRYPMNARAQGCPVEHCMLHIHLLATLMSWLTVYWKYLPICSPHQLKRWWNANAVFFTVSTAPRSPKDQLFFKYPKHLKMITMCVGIQKTTRLLEGKQTKLL